MSQIKYFFLFYLLFILNVDCTTEIITLQINGSILCITEDVVTPIFVLPPIVEESKQEVNILNNSKLVDDDWEIKNATSVLHGPVTDKRWEDFEIQYTNYMHFNNVSSLSFSIYSPHEIVIHLMNEKSMHYLNINWTNNEIEGKWTHLTIHLNNETVNIFENGKPKLSKNFNTTQIVMKTTTKLYWKVHAYNFKWSNTVQEENSTTLIIPPTGKSCVMLYASLCEDCVLDVGIALGTTERTVDIRSINTTDNLMMSWQSHRIDIEPDIETTITFHRRKNSEKGDKTGYWGIDVRQCPPIDKNNKVIYNVNAATLRKQNHTCTLLSEPDEHKRTTTNVEQNTSSQCPPGMLGSKCDIACEDILGSGRPYCEKSRICENSACLCGWGFYGDLCQENCAPGKWGLSCTETCNETCGNSCDIMTGECPKKENLIYSTENTPPSKSYMIILAVSGSIVLVLLLIGIIYCVTYCPRRLAANLGQSSDNTQEKESSSSNLLPI